MASILPEKLNQVPERERALLQQLSYGSLRQWACINWMKHASLTMLLLPKQ
jgi:hypothetical protein